MNTSSSDTRSAESLRHHFEIEKALATRLRASTRDGRTELFKTLYGDLFRLVPDHPRLTRVDQAAYAEKVSKTQMRLLSPALGADKVLVEFAPGDCHLARAAAPYVKKVIGIDISDQRTQGDTFPANFELVVYDGIHVPLPPASADIVFSYQFLEHLHPEDVEPHFRLAAELLRPGGVYIFDTPHRHSGPHDIAGHFGDELVCLHMQEWTYADMRRVLTHNGFSDTYAYRRGKPIKSALLNTANDAAESLLGLLPKSLRRKFARRLFTGVTIMAKKA